MAHPIRSPEAVLGLMKKQGRSRPSRLEDHVALQRYMTPTAQIAEKCGGRHRGRADTLASQVAELEGLEQSSTGALNPPWVEWLMGFPTGWTDLGHSETP